MAGRHVINTALEDLCAVLLLAFIRLADASRARQDPAQAGAFEGYESCSRVQQRLSGSSGM